MNYKLSPSDFAFLYEGCKRCYYLKVVHNISQPSIPLPSIFTKIAALLKDHYIGKRTEKLCTNLPPGVVSYGEEYVQSEIIQVPGHSNTCFIKGRFDVVVKFDEGGYGIIDFKTGSPNEEHHKLYSPQLHAYAYALENAAPGALVLSPVTKLGLLYFYPSSVSQHSVERIFYEAEICWIEIEKNYKEFLKFIGEVLNVLDCANLPDSSPTCEWCSYIRKLGNLRI